MGFCITIIVLRGHKKGMITLLAKRMRMKNANGSSKSETSKPKLTEQGV